MTELTDTERETLGCIAGRIGGWPGTAQLRDPELFTAVEAILTARLARVEALHRRMDSPHLGRWCVSCGQAWPCPTARAIAAPTPTEVQR